MDSQGRKSVQNLLIWLPSACAIVAVLYGLSAYNKNRTEKAPAHPMQTEAHASVDIKAYEEKLIESLPSDKKSELYALKKDTIVREEAWRNIALFWSSLHADSSAMERPLLYGYYMMRYAKAAHSEKELKSIGRMMTIMSMRTEQTSIRNLLLEWSGEALSEALKMNPQDDSLQADIASLSFWYNGQGKHIPPPMEAAAKLKSILQRNPHQTYVLQILGMASMMSGQYDKALSYFQRLVEELPKYANGMAFLGDAFFYKGDKKSAAYWYNNALITTDDERLKNELQEKVKNL